jgi:hypothetical protein
MGTEEMVPLELRVWGPGLQVILKYVSFFCGETGGHLPFPEEGTEDHTALLPP